jgi:uncharacterized coiled-coil protein SlyX
MFKFMSKKERRIKNLEVMVNGRDKLIADQEDIIANLKLMVKSLEEDLKAVKEEAYKTAKKPTTRKKAK